MPAELDLLEFFKALSDETRLKIVGLLARDSYSGEALAEMLGKKPATISHHLSYLDHLGLVEARMAGHSKLYRLRLDVVHGMAQRLLASEALPRAAAEVDARDDARDEARAYDAKVLGDFLRPDGTLKRLPAQQKKLQAVLRRLAREFEPGRRYPEKEVNAILGRFHVDTASLRRALIEYKLMERAGGKYWCSAGANERRVEQP
jgi:hypothetical protein